MFAWLQRIFSTSTPPPVAAAAPAVAPAAPVRLHVAAPVSWMQRSVADYEFTSWLFAAERHPDLFTNPTEDAILAELDAIVHSPQAGAHLVRRMPGVIPQLLQSLRDPDFSSAELARTIWHDVVLVSEVLRLANSVAYSPGNQITSIDHAILMLGQDGLRQLITSVAFKPIINMKSGSFTRLVAPRLWDQAERCALAARMLAQDSEVDPLDAFLAGLIHNVGLTVSLRVIDRMAEGKQPIGSPTFCNALAATGRTLSANIGREWHFPESVTQAVRDVGVASQTENAPALSPLARVLQLGDYLSKLDTLRRQRRIAAGDPRITDYLSDRELACMRELAALNERDRSVALARG
ncbi:MAG TPA: HDOD domain-containing protein [Noviherbaspirillum sp.]